MCFTLLFLTEPLSLSLSLIVQCQVHHFEIIGLDKLLDGSLESMNEEQATGDSVDMTEPEEMQHDNANVCFSLYHSLNHL